MNNTKTHWEKIYETKAASDFSWFQPYPHTSVDFIDLFKLPKNASIIDIGGGDSPLADALLELGFTNISVLDISAWSIARAKARLGERAATITWIEKDIVDFEPQCKYDFWHDRAAFHFLTTKIQIIKYLAIVKKGIKFGGHLVLGTFSDKSPDKWRGLGVRQYSEASMSALFEKDFKRIKCIEETHLTPLSTLQNFVFCSFQRTSHPIL